MPDQAIVEDVAGEDVVIGSREQLLHLLAEAAEIEHTLMCSYLYAAFSLKRSGAPGVSGTQGETLDRWRRMIMDVAVEEMGHLVIVANLTVAIGGAPHFARPNFPVAPGYFPSGVAVRLTGFDAETLKHFIFLERPQGDEGGEDSEEFEQRAYERAQARPGLMPSAQDYATIGHLYQAIRANLTSLHQRLGREGLFIGDAGSQLGSDVVDIEGVAPITDLAGAMAGIDIIVEQGEGSSKDRDVSHYRSFLAIQDELEAATHDDPDFSPAWPVADSPVLRQPPGRDGMVFIDHPDATQLLDVACATYGLLLRCLVQCFGRGGDHRQDAQKALMACAIELMHVLADTSTRLAQLPASSTVSGVNAGMTFTMLRSIERLPSGPSERRLLQERVALLRQAAAVLPANAQGALARAADRLSEFR